jgi:TolB protein
LTSWLAPRAEATVAGAQSEVRFTFSASYYRVSEGDKSVTITVVRSGDLGSEATVEYQASNGYLFARGCAYLAWVGTATPDSDYAWVRGTLRFAPGESSKTFQVAIIDDAQIEAREPETIFLSLDFSASAPEQSSACFGSTSTIYIHDNDPDAAPTPTPVITTSPKIAFFTNRDGNYEIYSMDEDGSNPRRLTDTLSSEGHPAWSPDGKAIAFVSDRDGGLGIYVMQADGSNQTKLFSGGIEVRDPAWSPDGSRIAFVGTRSGYSYEIFVINTDGSGQVNLTNNLGEDFQPAWSPDGKQIAFTSRRENGTFSVYVMNSDGSNPRRIVAEYSRDPAWSPDGKQIAFVANGEQSGSSIYVVNTDGSNRRLLSGNQPYTFNVNPAWSPDGKRIAFASNRDGYPFNYEIYSMNADGSNPLRLTNNPAHEGIPAWQPRIAPPSSAVPRLLTEANSSRAVALESVTWVLDPFSVVSNWNLSPDRRTRVILFASNLTTTATGDISVQAEDSNGRVYQLPVEHVERVPGFDWLTQINVRLAEELSGIDYVWVSLNVRGSVSNKAVVTLRAKGNN